jgi:predicted outer membrane repeat protein
MLARLAFPITVAAVLFAASDVALAVGVVGSGTPESCTETALSNVLEGNGQVTFDCGAAPHTIVMTFVKTLTANTNLIVHGGGTITLSGANTTAFFDIDAGSTLYLDGITLTRGFGEFGAIVNEGGLAIHNSRIEKCTSTSLYSGAITNYGAVGITGTTFAENSSIFEGGAIYSEEGLVTIADSTFTGNSTTGALGGESGGAIFSYSDVLDSLSVTNSTFTDNTSIYGGAIASLNSLTLDNVTFSANRSIYDGSETPRGDGGAVYVSGQASITNSTFTDNEALDGNGGAIYVEAGSTVNIARTTFSENEGGITGGALANDGSIDVRESTFHANKGAGAAIYNGVYSEIDESPVTALSNTTVSDNTSTASGALAALRGKITLAYVTVAGNSGASGIAEGQFASFEFSNSVFADNTPSNCLGLKPIGQSLGFNLSSDDSCELFALNDAPSTDPLLGPLADNGGPTLSRLPEPLSPAIDEGQCLPGFATDQRGIARPQGVSCDRGAVERSPEDSASGTCGDPVEIVASKDASANAVSASDALAVLNAAVGLSTCEFCICDIDDSGSISASDALATLLAAVGLPVELNCPACD